MAPPQNFHHQHHPASTSIHGWLAVMMKRGRGLLLILAYFLHHLCPFNLPLPYYRFHSAPSFSPILSRSWEWATSQVQIITGLPIPFTKSHLTYAVHLPSSFSQCPCRLSIHTLQLIILSALPPLYHCTLQPFLFVCLWAWHIPKVCVLYIGIAQLIGCRKRSIVSSIWSWVAVTDGSFFVFLALWI